MITGDPPYGTLIPGLGVLGVGIGTTLITDMGLAITTVFGMDIMPELMVYTTHTMGGISTLRPITPMVV